MGKKPEPITLSHGLELFFSDWGQRFYRDKNRRWQVKWIKAPKRAKVKTKKKNC